MTIQELKSKAQEVLADYAAEVLDSNGLSLYNLPNGLSRRFCDALGLSITKIIQTNEDALKDEDFQKIQKTLAQAQIIKTRYEKFELTFNKVVNRIKASPIELVSDEEIAQERASLLNDSIKSNEFFTKEEELYQLFIQNSCTNAAIKSGVFKSGAIIKIEELENINPRIAFHARKTAFDQICLLVFGHVPEKYDTMLKVEEINPNHNINSLMEIKTKNHQILFGYLNMNALTVPKFPRFAALISRHEGVGCSVEEVVHQHKVLDIQVVIAGEEVTVQVPVWYGVVVTKVSAQNNKPLDLEALLKDTEQLVVQSPDLSTQVSKINDEPSIISNYLQVFTKLATVTNQNYTQVINQLRQQGAVNASH